MKQRTESHRVPTEEGRELAAKLELPVGAPSAWAVFAHCFTCSKDLKAVVRISRALAETGFGVLRFDFTGLGESEGEFSDTDFTSNVEDLVAAARYVEDLAGGGPDLLVGHSLGGAAALAAGSRLPRVRAIATIGAPSDTDHLKDTLLRQAPELERVAEARIELAGRTFRVRRDLIEDLAETRMEEMIPALDRPLLIFHSPVDTVVGIDHAARIYELAKHPKSFVSLDRADHLLLEDPEDSRFLASVLAAWASRYAMADDAPHASDERTGARGRVEATLEGDRYTTVLRAGEHRWMADEPVAVGGADAGPTPYEMLLAALGACKTMTLRMYADRKEWPLDGVRVVLTHDRIHAEDCEDCETKGGRIDRIEVEVDPAGDLDDEQRRRLLEISERCPVHRTLTSEISLRSRLAGSSGGEAS